MKQAEPYFITGLPRSKTAWLANLLTTGPSFCHHDAVRLGVSVAALKKLFASTEYQYIGNSDSGMTALPYDSTEAFPESKWVFIRRDPIASALSYQKHFTKEPYRFVKQFTDEEAMDLTEHLDKILDVMQNLLPQHRKMIVRFDDLEKEQTVKAIWEYVLPHMPWQHQRWHMLNTFRVNIIGPKVALAGDLIRNNTESVWDL